MEVIELSDIEKKLSRDILNLLESEYSLDTFIGKSVSVRCNITVEYVDGKLVVTDRPSVVRIGKDIAFIDDKGKVIDWMLFTLTKTFALKLILYEKHCGALTKMIAKLEKKRRRVEDMCRRYKEIYTVLQMLQ